MDFSWVNKSSINGGMQANTSASSFWKIPVIDIKLLIYCIWLHQSYGRNSDFQSENFILGIRINFDHYHFISFQQWGSVKKAIKWTNLYESNFTYSLMIPYWGCCFKFYNWILLLLFYFFHRNAMRCSLQRKGSSRYLYYIQSALFFNLFSP